MSFGNDGQSCHFNCVITNAMTPEIRAKFKYWVLYFLISEFNNITFGLLYTFHRGPRDRNLYPAKSISTMAPD